MKNFMFFAVLILCSWIPASLSVPVQVVNSHDDQYDLPEELVLDDDDSTTRTLERLASAATCLVAGVEYTHGQQIYRKDPCEFCLCLDGEMFCWWQDCPPVSEGPCRDRRPFSPCANGGSPDQSTSYPTRSYSTTNYPTKSTTLEMESSTSSDADNTSLSSSLSSSEEPSSTDATEATSTVTETHHQTSTQATVCVVMGKEYKIGEMLPHATGNCVECLCGEGARVTCSPHHCAPLGDNSIGQPMDNLDVF